MDFTKDFNKKIRNKLLKEIDRFEIPKGNKKYIAIFKDGKKIKFGDKNYFHFKDSTPNQEYKFLNHLDPDRRRLYYLRHNKNYELYSPDTLSKIFLW